MGAQDFNDSAFGKDANEAFGKAIEAAHWEFGHDPYNGTISTVGSFNEFVKPKSLTDDEFERLVWAAEYGDDLAKLEDMPVRRKFRDEWDRKRYMADRALANKLKKLNATERELIKRAGASIEKWECCVCYKADANSQKRYREQRNLKGKHGAVYNFFGLASC
jgi:hypothetical protein